MSMRGLSLRRHKRAFTSWIPWAAGVLSAVFMALRLLWPTPVGMADNNDASRLLCQIGANALAPSVRLYSHVKFTVFGFPKAAPGAACDPYPTSQAGLLRVIAWFHTHVLGAPGRIDLREAIVVYSMLAGAAVAAGVRVLLPRSRWAAGVWAVGLFVVLGDATFADYAASPYSEPAALDGLLVFAVAGALLVGRSRGRGAVFLLAWAAAVFAVMAKTETATLAPALGAFFATQCLEIPWRRAGFGGRLHGRWHTRPRLPHRLRGRTLPVLSILIMVAAARYTLIGAWVGSSSLPEQFTNVANEVTMTVMPNAEDPGDVAVGLGLPRSFGAYSGTNVWSPHPIQHDPAFVAVADRFTQRNLGGYLAQHPVLTGRVLASGSGSYTQFRNRYLGTYAYSADHAPGDQECRLCLVTDLAHGFAWAGFTGVVASWAAFAAAAVRLLRRTRAGSPARGFAAVGLTLTGCAVTEYVTAVFGEGNEVTKHLAPALFAAALAPLWLVVAALLARSPGRAPIPHQVMGPVLASPDNESVKSEPAGNPVAVSRA